MISPSLTLPQVRSHSGIEFLEPNQISRIAGSQNNPPWGLARIDSRYPDEIDSVYTFNDQSKCPRPLSRR